MRSIGKWAGFADANGPEDVATDRDVTPPWESDQRDVLRTTFDQDAEAYDRSRPVAPDDVFDEVMQRASLSAGSTVVEIETGTGQATRHLAAADCTWLRRARPSISPAAGEPGGLSERQRRDGIVRVLGSRHRPLRHRLCVQFLSLDRPGHPFRQGSDCAAPGRTSRGPRNPVGRSRDRRAVLVGSAGRLGSRRRALRSLDDAPGPHQGRSCAGRTGIRRVR